TRKLLSSACARLWRSRWWNWACPWRAFAPRSTSKRAWRCSPRPAKAIGTTGMTAGVCESLPITKSDHVVIVRQAVRRHAVALGFSLVDQTKIVTAASELARNTLVHGGGGEALIESLADGVRKGL